MRINQWAAVLVLAMAQISFAQATQPAGVTGTYKWTSQAFGGDQENTMKLKQEGDKLTGTISGFGGEDTAFTDGKVDKDGTISFKVVRDFGGQPITTLYTGKVSGDTFKGKSETIFAQEINAKRSAQ